MNICIFGGKIHSIEKIEENPSKVLLELEIRDSRKSKLGRLYDTYYPIFEAWDSAADYLLENCKIGDKLIVKSSLKRHNGHTIFRINEFETLS